MEGDEHAAKNATDPDKADGGISILPCSMHYGLKIEMIKVRQNS